MNPEIEQEEMFRRLGRRLCCAFHSWRLNLTYNTCDKKTPPEEEIGELWVEIAKLVWETFNKNVSFLKPKPQPSDKTETTHETNPSSQSTSSQRCELLETTFNISKLAKAIDILTDNSNLSPENKQRIKELLGLQ